MRSALVLFVLLLATPALAAHAKPQSSAPKPANVVSEEDLFARLAKADSPEAAHPIEQQLNGMFRISGSPSVDLLMTRAKAALGATNNKLARTLLAAVTGTIAPRYAEAWHLRAGLEAAAGDDTAALVSLQKVVLLNPRQFNALNELAGMLEDYGDKAGALKLYRRALKLDPQLEDAARRVKALTKDVEGQDI